MSITAALQIAMTLNWTASPMQIDASPYIASASFIDGQCVFWTGDVGMTAQELESDLRDRFDVKRGIVILYKRTTPPRCVNLARHSAARAGFNNVTVAVDPHAGAIGPPMSKS